MPQPASSAWKSVPRRRLGRTRMSHRMHAHAHAHAHGAIVVVHGRLRRLDANGHDVSCRCSGIGPCPALRDAVQAWRGHVLAAREAAPAHRRKFAAFVQLAYHRAWRQVAACGEVRGRRLRLAAVVQQWRTRADEARLARRRCELHRDKLARELLSERRRYRSCEVRRFGSLPATESQPPAHACWRTVAAELRPQVPEASQLQGHRDEQHTAPAPEAREVPQQPTAEAATASTAQTIDTTTPCRRCHEDAGDSAAPTQQEHLEPALKEALERLTRDRAQEVRVSTLRLLEYLSELDDRSLALLCRKCCR